ncbi:MAG: DUF4349 domain-containing protein [Phormidesmis sp. RL_2_1]|nr:DUF4349 domain-containing protein [Phormidesmis sp. RL_2_1]
MAFTFNRLCLSARWPDKLWSSARYAANDEMAAVMEPAENGAIASNADPMAQEISAIGTTQSSDSANHNLPRLQLIKRADMTLSVESVEESLEQVRKIVQAQQGDVLSLNDTGDRNRQITFQLRVPQAKLDATLDALTALGTVQNRSISTEDVSTQLVDLQARLSNARKSEAALQEIMSRTGSIADVLQVSRELSNVRQSIEQMAAAQKNLQNQVQYSTIDLRLASTVTSPPQKPAFSRQLANSWGDATHSVGNFTTDLLQLGLWLLVYSPYLAVLLCGAVVLRKVSRRRPSESER